MTSFIKYGLIAVGAATLGLVGYKVGKKNGIKQVKEPEQVKAAA